VRVSELFFMIKKIPDRTKNARIIFNYFDPPTHFSKKEKAGLREEHGGLR